MGRIVFNKDLTGWRSDQTAMVLFILEMAALVYQARRRISAVQR